MSIPVNEPSLDETAFKYVEECLRTGWISSSGKFIQAFEQQWAAYCGRSYGIAVCNGTAALEAAMACLDLQPGDEVIIPTFTIISCALAVVQTGATPVLVDCDPRTWCMDVRQVAEKISPRTRAIMPVHIYGHPVDMQPILELAEKHGLSIIEDAAEAHGAEYKGKKAGSFGDMSCFSFYANKIITTGEGGMVLTNSAVLAERLRAQRNLCFKEGRRFFHTELGHNYRMTNLQAAIGLSQLETIEQRIQHKRWMAQRYSEQLKDIPELQLPVEEPWARQVYWMYAIVLDESSGMDAAQLAQQLTALGIETRPFFLGMHEQPVFHQRGLFVNERYPVAERIARQGLYLPSGATLTQEQIDQVCSAIRKVLQ